LEVGHIFFGQQNILVMTQTGNFPIAQKLLDIWCSKHFDLTGPTRVLLGVIDGQVCKWM
jgi:hypothetical protein